MQGAVFHCSFHLKEGASVEGFLQAAEKLNNEYISKQKGCVSWQQLNNGDTWLDILTFETMEDVKAFEANPAGGGELAGNFYSFINPSSIKLSYFTIERSYK